MEKSPLHSTTDTSRSEEIAGKIKTQIDIWLKQKSRIIIGIDGYSASGKSTVSELLEKSSDITVVHLDDLLKPSKERVELMNNAEDRSKIFEYLWYRYDILEDILKSFLYSSQDKYSVDVYDYDLQKTVTKSYDLTRPALVVEGIFLFHPEHIEASYFDKKIYLDIDFAHADELRAAREKLRWGDSYKEEDHPESFAAPFKEAYRRYYATLSPHELADVTISVR